MSQPNIRQGLTAGIALSVFFAVSLASQSEDPVRTLLVVLLVTATALALTTVVVRRIRSR